jgi:hypothetical protein
VSTPTAPELACVTVVAVDGETGDTNRMGADR